MSQEYEKRVARAKVESFYIKKLFQWIRLLLIVFGVTVLLAAWGFKGAAGYQTVIGWISVVLSVLSAVCSGIVVYGIHRGKKHIEQLISK